MRPDQVSFTLAWAFGQMRALSKVIIGALTPTVEAYWRAMNGRIIYISILGPTLSDCNISDCDLYW